MGGYSESEWPLLFCTNACTARADPLSVGTSHAGLLDIGEASPSPSRTNRTPIITIQDITAINGERLLRLAAVRAMTGLRRSTLCRLIQQGEFPAPIHPLGHSRFAAWRLSEVRQWIKQVAA